MARTALVTGAAGGIGLAITRALLDEGYEVVLVDASPRVAELAAELAGSGLPATALQLDLGDIPAVEAAAAALLAEHGVVDTLVNNAGIHIHGPKDELQTMDIIDLENWESTFRVNLTAPFVLSRALLPAMKAQGWGRVVNIASRAGRTWIPGGSASYSASKAGIIGLTRTIAGEYAAFGVTANVVSPGPIESPLMRRQSDEVIAAGLSGIPRGVVGQPEDIAGAVRYLASEGAANVVGAVIDVNGGGFMP
ncbi:SDR family NAD(P)-dependent oxidoreductase [Frondihabitans cladoniiphilus]|uniref:SDR family NAD(P)-dependent oxidoreductase n=1 Tax=Frondihabitans cladoniiphilus TaxID=715785 RepID=A0ABP8WDK9_9MICO